MKQNCFQIENLLYDQHEGTAMTNPWSPFLAKLFMARCEMEARK